jgi:cytochrome c-type biogenesis protein CcmH
MIWLWIAAALISAGLAALIVQRAARAASAVQSHAVQGQGASDDNPALGVYRRQMAELDELAERGLLAEDERRSVRAETGRRLLAAAGRAEAPLKASGPTVILVAAAAVPLVALAAYFLVGAPNRPDLPFAQRLAQWRAADPQSLSPPQMAALLRVIAAERPNDPEPLKNLAIAELASGQPGEAVQALQRAIALAPKRADLLQLAGEIQVVQANGEVDDGAQGLFRRALAIDPTAPTARYYLARARIAGGDVPGGLADWRALDATMAADDPRKASLEGEIAQVTRTGRLTQPQAESPGEGPAQGQAQVGGPQIQAMVDGLAARLAAHPDDPDGWVRLVRAYTVLGESDRRDAALAEARKRYAGRPDVLKALTQAMQPPPS